MSHPPQIPAERKTLYYLGAALMGAGFVLFLSNFYFIARGPDLPFQHNPMPGLVFRGLGGMLLIIGGGFLRGVGARGAAGSGLVLDPQQAREDLKPWAQTAGGLMKDALDEARAQGGLAPAAPAEPMVKVRCPRCRTLNDEDAKYCKQCGAPL